MSLANLDWSLREGESVLMLPKGRKRARSSCWVMAMGMLAAGVSIGCLGRGE